MAGIMLDWRKELERWLRPFLERLGHKTRRRMCPVYISGLIGPGDRKSIQPSALRLAPMTNCTTLSLPERGTRLRSRQNCLFKQISSSAAGTPCW